MKLRNRFALVILGVLIFLIVTPILIIYAGGFRIDWKNHTLIKTGAIVVKTQPTKAQVFLDGKLIDSSPASIRFLSPADYEVRVTHDGYQSWTKRLSVKSQLVTWANADRNYLALFLTEPTQTQTWQTMNNTLSRLSDQIIFTTANTAGVINIDTGEVSNQIDISGLKFPTINPTTGIKWQDANKILSLLQSGIKWNLTQSQINQISQLETDGNHIVLKLGADLYSLDGGNLNLLDKNVLGFTLSQDGVWYVQENQIKHYSFSSKNSDTVLTNLPDAKQVQIIRTENQIYMILDQTLYLVSDKLEKIYSPVTVANYDKNSHQLVYANDNEIFVYHPDSRNSDLILRSLTAISNPILNDETGYIFFKNENKIKAIELDGRDHRNIYTIADALDNFALSLDGKKLFTINSTLVKEYEIR